MKTNKLSLALFIGISIIILVAQSNASDEDLFSTTVPPDALIILDMSGSMNWDVAGIPASSPNRRIDIAKSVIFDLLDDDDTGKRLNPDGTSSCDGSYIDSNDETSLNVRLGYMRFRHIGEADDDDGDFFNGNIKIFSRATEIGANTVIFGEKFRIQRRNPQDVRP